MEGNRVKVTIYGHTYNIQGDASPDYIVRLAGYVNEKMEDVGKNISSGKPLQVAILAALNIADEYYQLKESKAGVNTVIEQKTKALISMLDEGLIGDIFSNCVDSAKRV